MKSNNYYTMEYLTSYLKTHNLDEITTNYLFELLDILQSDKNIYLKYWQENDIYNIMNKLWALISIIIAICIYRYDKLTGISIGVLFNYIPHLALSKITNMEYNELVTKITNTLDERLKEQTLSRNLGNK